MNIDPSTTKYLIKAELSAEGVVEKPDVVGAIFGQTEGLLGDELDLRDLQKSGRIGRIEVEVQSERGKSVGRIYMPSSLDQVETSILAAALETIDRIGPCKAKIEITDIEDIRVAKKQKIVERAKELLQHLMEKSKVAGMDLTENVRQAIQVEEIISYGPDKCPAGPNVEDSDAILIVEGRSDVLNLLKHGIKNAIAVEGTSVPKTIIDLSREKIVTVFVDGDRGGNLILKELLQTVEVDFVAEAPYGKEVEELTQKQIMKALRNKMPVEQYLEMRESGIAETGRSRTAENTSQKANSRDSRMHHGDEETKDGKHFFRSIVGRVKERTRAEKRLSHEQKIYKNLLENLSGSRKAAFINPSGEIVKEVAVKDLVEAISSPPRGAVGVVFDGVITQRLIDLGYENDIKKIVGMRMSNVTKTPTSMSIYIKEDFE